MIKYEVFMAAVGVIRLGVRGLLMSLTTVVFSKWRGGYQLLLSRPFGISQYCNYLLRTFSVNILIICSKVVFQIKLFEID